MKNLSISLLLLVISSLAIGQTKDFSKLTAEQKRVELNKKLQWINAKMGVRYQWVTINEALKDFGEIDDHTYDSLVWDVSRPNIIEIKTYVRIIKPRKPGQKTNYREVSTSTIDLSKVYQVKYLSGAELTKQMKPASLGDEKIDAIKFIGNEIELSTYKEQPFFTVRYKTPTQGELPISKAFSTKTHFDPTSAGKPMIDAWNDAIILAGGGKGLEKSSYREADQFGKLKQQIHQKIFAADTPTVSGERIKSLVLNPFGDILINKDGSDVPERFNLLNLVNLSNASKGFVRTGETLVFYTNIEQVMREDNSTYEVTRVVELKFANVDTAKEVEGNFSALYKYLLSPATE